MARMGIDLKVDPSRCIPENGAAAVRRLHRTHLIGSTSALKLTLATRWRLEFWVSGAPEQE
jgi:hypothetical protein